MRLDFNVLWVEDQQAAVEAQRERIDTQVRKEGFRLRVKFASTVAVAKDYLSDDIYGDHIDLVLMDYDLGAGAKGDQGLVEVRNIFPYKDIVFYSSRAPDLPDMVANKKVQGVFCSTRDSLIDTVEGVFEALVKKVLDIDHSRGIIMGATSDIDHYVNDCLVAGFEKSDVACREAVLAVVMKHMKKKCEGFEKDVKRITAVKHVTDLHEFHNIYTSYDRLKLLKSMLEAEGLHAENVLKITSYMSRTVPRRNDLAHVRVKVDGFSRKLFDRNNNELTSEQMRSLRQELLEFQDLFEKLSAMLNSSVP